MKKKIILVLFLCLFIFINLKNDVKAESYTSFEEINFYNDDVELVEDWSYIRKASLKNKIKNKMFGWGLVYYQKKEYFDYVSETLYHVKNSGLEDITHTFKYEETDESTVQRTVTGSLELSSSVQNDKTKIGKFKFGLEGELEYEYKETNKTKVSQTDTVKIVIAPNTELYIKVKGKGYLTNGYAIQKFFFIPVREGGFEYVVITTEYYSIDVVIIDESKITNGDDDE